MMKTSFSAALTLCMILISCSKGVDSKPADPLEQLAGDYRVIETTYEYYSSPTVWARDTFIGKILKVDSNMISLNQSLRSTRPVWYADTVYMKVVKISNEKDTLIHPFGWTPVGSVLRPDTIKMKLPFGAPWIGTAFTTYQTWVRIR